MRCKAAWVEAEIGKKIDEIAKDIADRVSKGEDFAAVAGIGLAAGQRRAANHQAEW